MGHATGPLAHHTFEPWTAVSGTGSIGDRPQCLAVVDWRTTAHTTGERHRVLVNGPCDVFAAEYNFRTHGGLPVCWAPNLSPGWRTLGPDRLFTIEDARQRLMGLVFAADELDWLVVTTQPYHAAKVLADFYTTGLRRELDGDGWGEPRPTYRKPYPNLWVGVRVTCQADADALVPALLRVPAAVRFVLCSPLTGPVDLERVVLKPAEFPERGQPPVSMKALTGWYGGADQDKTRLDWIAVAGPAGADAKPCHPAWVRALRDQATAAGVAFRFDGWGEFVPYEHTAAPPILESQHGHHVDGHLLPHDLADRPNRMVAGNWLMDDHHDLYRRVGSKAAGRTLDGEVWDEVPVGKTVGA